jgi:hypothetical protein
MSAICEGAVGFAAWQKGDLVAAKLLDYGRNKYIRYHGSEEGWAAVVKQAQTDPGIMPLAGFTVAKGSAGR